jgi:hypothetical protein
MGWLTEALGGPVLAWELKRATRLKLWRYLQVAYCAWLTCQALALLNVGLSASRILARQVPLQASSALDAYSVTRTYQIEFLNSYLDTLLQLQLLLVMAIVPVITASCLGQEKERGTLFELFGTALTSRQILVGKLLGRLILIVPMILTTLPALVFIATWTERGLGVVALALCQEAVIAITIGAACLLFGIWVRGATEATIASYLFLGLIYFAVRGFTYPLPWAFWFDPVQNLRQLLNGGFWFVLALHLAVWAFAGGVCLRLGWGRLRKVCVEQRDRKPPRRLWAFRPPVGSDPFRWRECYVIGLAPLPILRIVPRWLALLGVFACSMAVACMIANSVSPEFGVALANLNLARAIERLLARRHDIGVHISFLGLIFVLAASLLVGVRCGTSVPEEKRRHTWDELLLTAQSFREITHGKMWGVLQATLPYVLAYAVPVFLLAMLGGPASVVVASIWIGLPCFVVLLAALGGIDMVSVPPDMDETREGGAFWFEKDAQGQRRPGRQIDLGRRASEP